MMDFELITQDPQLSDSRIFVPDPMGLRDELLRVPIDKSIRHDQSINKLSLNFADLQTRTARDVFDIRNMLAETRLYNRQL